MNRQGNQEENTWHRVRQRREVAKTQMATSGNQGRTGVREGQERETRGKSPKAL